jgi:signal transduction histidine kinase
MIALRDLSIRVKLLGLVALSSILSLLIAGAAMITYDLFVYKRNAIASLATQAQMLASISAGALAFNDRRAAGDYLATLRERSDVPCAALYAADGSVFARYQRKGAPACTLPAATGDGVYEQDDTLLLFSSVVQRGERLGTVYLRLNLERAARAARYAAIVGAVLVGSLVLGLAGSTVLRRSVIQPLLEIAEIARGVSVRRDYGLRATKHSNDEVGMLTDAFNQMLMQIEGSAEDLQRSNARLLVEIDEHRRAREEVLALNATLEQRVAERTQQLMLANKELESFSYSVSHDLRTPLRAIDGFSAALLRSHAGQLDERGRDYLQRVRAATQRMGMLIDDLLSLARTARAEMNRRTVDLSDMAATVARDLREAHPEYGVQFDIAQGLLADADPQLMRVVLDNLLGNAAKFSSKASDAKVEFDHMSRNGQSVFFVRDNGVGFDMSYANKLFGVFQRLHSSSEFEGTGIGLANVYRAIQRHGGTIWAEGQPGRGATFYFTLPTPS